jgi:hypothetical protein
MKKFAKIIVISIFCFPFSLITVFSQDTTAIKQNTSSQKLKFGVYLFSGQLDFLKNEKIINIEFIHENTIVGRENEVDYLAYKVKVLNEKKTGKGDAWLIEWNEKIAEGEKLMVELLNIQLEKINLTFQKDFKSAKYTLLVNSYKIEEGWQAGVTSEMATVVLDLRFLETNDRNKQTAHLSCLGMGKALHLSDAYGGAGSQLGKAINKNLSSAHK